MNIYDENLLSLMNGVRNMHHNIRSLLVERIIDCIIFLFSGEDISVVCTNYDYHQPAVKRFGITKT